MNTVIHTASLIALALIVIYAASVDLRLHRIPNRLNICGFLTGMALQTFLDGWHGMGVGFAGAVAGLACFAPLYLLRGMGAGDVKLLAVVGVFLGPHGAWQSAAAALMAGGCGAMGFVLWRSLRATVFEFRHNNGQDVGASAAVAFTMARRERLPFAPAIAFGTSIVMLAQVAPYAASQWAGAQLL